MKSIGYRLGVGILAASLLVGVAGCSSKPPVDSSSTSYVLSEDKEKNAESASTVFTFLLRSLQTEGFKKAYDESLKQIAAKSGDERFKVYAAQAEPLIKALSPEAQVLLEKTEVTNEDNIKKIQENVYKGLSKDEVTEIIQASILLDLYSNTLAVNKLTESTYTIPADAVKVEDKNYSFGLLDGVFENPDGEIRVQSSDRYMVHLVNVDDRWVLNLDKYADTVANPPSVPKPEGNGDK